MTEGAKPAVIPKVAKSKAATPKAVASKQPVGKAADQTDMHAARKAKPIKEDKHKKQKMVRDSFTMPHDDYSSIALVKERCLKAGVHAKKSEILRAALISFAALSDSAVLKALNKLPTIKTGRPVTK